MAVEPGHAGDPQAQHVVEDDLGRPRLLGDLDPGRQLLDQAADGGGLRAPGVEPGGDQEGIALALPGSTRTLPKVALTPWVSAWSRAASTARA